jgi:alanine-glyoxylate transaminase/serine-glyoxylate transaminase/serine-pyruvate transaminase
VTRSGRHFLQIPGPTNLPDRVLRAIDRPTIDHRGPEFAQLAKECLAGMQRIVQTKQPVIIYPASGTGAWEAALVNTLSPGDRVLMFETGHFAVLWKEIAVKLGLQVEFVAGDWRSGADPSKIPSGDYAAVCVVHNETSTGVTSNMPRLRKAIGDGPLLMVDTISSLASIDYRHDEWGVDVTVAGSQKGLMLPPGLSFNAISPRAMEASRKATSKRSYWDWAPMLQANRNGFFPFTPATNLLYGLREAIAMLEEEGLPQVFARNARHAEATRRAVRAWGLELNCTNESEHSNTLTGIRVQNADELRDIILDKFDLSLGQGLGKLKGILFRIGHLGWFNDLMLCGTLAGVEMGLALAKVPHRPGGVLAAMEYLK